MLSAFTAVTRSLARKFKILQAMWHVPPYPRPKKAVIIIMLIVINGGWVDRCFIPGDLVLKIFQSPAVCLNSEVLREETCSDKDSHSLVMSLLPDALWEVVSNHLEQGRRQPRRLHD